MTLILLLILVGILLILAEIFVVPGIGIVGVIGIICLSAGVYFAYGEGDMVGHLTLGGTSTTLVALTFLAFRSNTWKKMMVKTELTGKMNTVEDLGLQVGDEGITVSRLAPMGKAKINGKQVEVQTLTDFIDENVPVQILRIEGTNVTVKPVSAASDE